MRCTGALTDAQQIAPPAQSLEVWQDAGDTRTVGGGAAATWATDAVGAGAGALVAAVQALPATAPNATTIFIRFIEACSHDAVSGEVGIEIPRRA